MPEKWGGNRAENLQRIAARFLSARKITVGDSVEGTLDIVVLRALQCFLAGARANEPYWHDLFGLHTPEQQSVSSMQVPFVWLQHLPPLQPFGKQQSPLSAQAAPSGVHAQFP